MSSPYNAATSADATGVDTRTTITGYAAVVPGDTTGWTLHHATAATVQMGATSPSSADLVSTSRYNPAGQIIEKRLPADPTGAGAGTTKTTYYTAGTSGTCVSNVMVGLPCSTGPAAQPSGNPLPVTVTTYDSNDNTLTTTGTAGSTVRTTTTGYDPAERRQTQTITVTPTAAGGTALPTTTWTYDPATGQVASTSTNATGTGTGTPTLTTSYDTLGRMHTYTDATGNFSTTGYDLAGRPVTIADGKGTTSYT